MRNEYIADWRDLPTPALVVDHDALMANIARMSDFARTAGVDLRPHAKSHKSAAIGRLLVEAGAIGAACATLEEAEAMAAAGIPGILVTTPIASRNALRRIGDLLSAGADIALVLDDEALLPALGDIAAGTGTPLPVLLELDVGQRRTGFRDIAAAVHLARRVTGTAGFRFAGVQAYWGHLQHVRDRAERRALVATQAKRVKELLTALSDAGMPAGIVTGGGTGTVLIDAELGLFTELQPGSFLFNDADYAAVEIAEGGNPFATSLTVLATVISAKDPGRVIVDAGTKAFATDSGHPVPWTGCPDGAAYRFMGDEMGAIDFPADARNAPVVGDRVELQVSHCDPTVNLYSRYFVRRDGEPAGSWPIEARR